MARGKRIIAAAVSMAVIAMASAGCAGSHIHPSLSEFAITTGHGYFSNQDVINVASPGQNVKLGSGTTTWYFPASVRNYVTATSGGDRSDPTPALTASGGHGDPGMSDQVYTYVGFEVNPAITVNNQSQVPLNGKSQTESWTFATHFLNFCLKYGCASQQPQNTSANAQKERSSDPGWLNMVDEIFPNAIDNATRDAIVSFKPDLWTDQGEWSKLASDISAALPGEIQALDGSHAEGQPDYFCGSGSTAAFTKVVKGKTVQVPAVCKPFLVQVLKVVPSDQGVITAYQQQQQSDYQLSAAASRLTLSRELYGADAPFFNGVKDTIAACQAAKITCTIYLGSPPVHP
jgi:hypothetical protein